MRRIAAAIMITGALVCFSCGNASDSGDEVAANKRPPSSHENTGGTNQGGNGNGGVDSGTGSDPSGGGSDPTGGGGIEAGGEGGSGNETGGGGEGGSGSETGGGGTGGLTGGGGTGGVTGGGGTGGVTGGGGSGGTPCVPPVSGTCNNSPQCGCPSGQGCYISNIATGATACYAAGGTALGARCTYDNDCAAGATCELGGCKRYCRYDSDCPGGAGVKCVHSLYRPSEGADLIPIPFGDYCTDHCTPWTTNSCGTGMECWTYSGIGVTPGTWVCVPNPSTNSGACSATVDCRPGYICMTSGSTGNCRRFCRMATLDCGGSITCTAISSGTITGLYWGTTQIGFCPS